MKTLLLLIPFITFGQKIDDKVLHFYSGAGITFVTGSIVNHYTHKPTLSTWIGIGTGVLAGLGKEYIYDKAMNKGVFSKDDYLMTAWGAACGGVVIRCVIDFKERDKQPRKNDYKYEIY